jgi:hypothetical protein
MHIDWSSLGLVAAVSAGVTVAVVAVFAVGVLGLARADAATRTEAAATGTEGAGAEAAGAGTSAPPSAFVQAGLCFLVCAAVVAYGIYLIVPQFH